jgi:hypothetical protein
VKAGKADPGPIIGIALKSTRSTTMIKYDLGVARLKDQLGSVAGRCEREYKQLAPNLKVLTAASKMPDLYKYVREQVGHPRKGPC